MNNEQLPTSDKVRIRISMVAIFFGGFLTTSAYPVYYNMVGDTGLPPIVSFFWFSFFAALAAFLYPVDIVGGLSPFRRSSAAERLKLMHPGWPWKLWYEETKRKKGFGLVALATISSIVYFLFLLTALGAQQPNIVLTVVVIQQLNPLIFSALGYWFLGDTCRSWAWFSAGSLSIALGVTLYKYDLQRLGRVDFFDSVFFLMLGVLVFEAMLLIFRTKYRRDFKVDALDAARTVYLFSSLIAFFAVLFMGHSLAVTSKQLLGLCYLGLVPTAIGNIVINRAQDVVGVPWTKTASALRPIYIIGWSFVPVYVFAAGGGSLGIRQVSGIAMACLGIIVIAFFAKPEPVRGSAITPK